MKVDIFDKKLDKWMPGIIIEATRVDSKMSKISVRKDGYGKEFDESLMWPSPEVVTFCGE